MAGSGSLENSIKEKIKQIGAKIHFNAWFSK
jgi:hypothetical protein